MQLMEHWGNMAKFAPQLLNMAQTITVISSATNKRVNIRVAAESVERYFLSNVV